MKKGILIYYLLLCLSFISYSQNGIESLNNIRIQAAKESVVKILFDNIAMGTGFIINSNGHVVTCMHIIDNEKIKFDTITQKILNKIEIETYDKKRYITEVHDYFISGIGHLRAKLYDFIVLVPRNRDNRKFKYFPESCSGKR